MATRTENAFDHMEAISSGSKTIGYKCRSCRYHSTSLNSIDHHILGHKFQQDFFNCENSSIKERCCPECDFTTYLTIPYRQHMIERHVCKLEQDDIESNTYICEKCKFRTSFILTWFKHVTDCPIDQEKWFHCDYCNYKTKRKDSMQRHRIVRHLPEDEIGWFRCTYCCYKSKTKSLLKLHQVAKHLPEDEIRWFRCHCCDYKARKRYYLQHHVKYKHSIGDEAGWFKCDRCDYKTTTKGNLKVHRIRRHLSHDEINWFECAKCDYKAKVKGHLRRHMRSMHLPDNEIVWFECDQCYYKTKRKSYLSQHVKTMHTPNWLKSLETKYEAIRKSEFNLEDEKELYVRLIKKECL